MPALPPRTRVDSVDGPAARGDEDSAVCVRRCRDDLVVRPEGPAQARPLAAAKVVRVQTVIPRAEVEPVPDEKRRRLDRARVDSPELVAGASVPGDDEPRRPGLVLTAGQLMHERLVDDPVADRGRGGRAMVEVPSPDNLAGAGVDREEPPLLLSYVDLPVSDRRRELDVPVRLQLPEAVVGRP